MDQPEGSYSRLNGALLQSGEHAGYIVSVVGLVESFDGQHLQCRCSDGKTIRAACDANVSLDTFQGSVMELVGLANPSDSANGVSMMVYVARQLAKDMDMELYDRMLQVQRNPKFSEYFTPVRDNPH